MAIAQLLFQLVRAEIQTESCGCLIKFKVFLLLKSSFEIINDYRLSRQGPERPARRMG